MKATEILKRIKNGDRVIFVETGAKQGYTDYYRFLSDGETAPCKSLRSLERADKFDFSTIILIPQVVATMKHVNDWHEEKDAIRKYAANFA